MLCDNERICCHSTLDLSVFVVLYVSQDVRRHTDALKHTVVLPFSYSLLYFEDVPDYFYLSVTVHMLFVNQINHLLKLYVSLHVVPLAYRFMWQCSTNYLMSAGCPAWAHCPLHRHKVCVFTPGSLSARVQIMVRARGSPLFSSPHHSFDKLISSSLWPAVIYSPVYFMAHFRISASLYVQANLHLQHCLYCVISVTPLFLCNVPCKTTRLELWGIVITLIPRYFIV